MINSTNPLYALIILGSTKLRRGSKFAIPVQRGSVHAFVNEQLYILIDEISWLATHTCVQN